MFFFEPMNSQVILHDNGAYSYLSSSGHKRQIQAWEMLSGPAQQLVINICGRAFTDIDSLHVDRCVMTTSPFFGDRPIPVEPKISSLAP